MPRNSEDGKICVFCTPAQEKLCFLARYSPNVLFDSVFPPECVHNKSILPKMAARECISLKSCQKPAFRLRWSTKYRFLDMIWPGCSSERVTSIEAPSHMRRWASCPPRGSALAPAVSLGKASGFYPVSRKRPPLGGAGCVMPALPFYSRVREW